MKWIDSKKMDCLKANCEYFKYRSSGGFYCNDVHLSLDDITPEGIKDDEVLFDEGLGLDSLDAVEIVVILQRKFGLEVKDLENRKDVFYSIDTLNVAHKEHNKLFWAIDNGCCPFLHRKKDKATGQWIFYCEVQHIKPTMCKKYLCNGRPPTCL